MVFPERRSLLGHEEVLKVAYPKQLLINPSSLRLRCMINPGSASTRRRLLLDRLLWLIFGKCSALKLRFARFQRIDSSL